MLRLIIVDDEKIIRESIRSLIDWESLGIEVVGVCKNGLEAYDAILDSYPDIVLTDIKMPGLSGLELIEKLNDTRENIQFIILSGYSEFEYAKQAMRFGIRHYLLKPCNENQIIEAIEDVKKACYLKQQADQEPEQNVRFEKSVFRNILTDGLTNAAEPALLCDNYQCYLDFTHTAYDLHYVYFLMENNLQECCGQLQDFMEEILPGTMYPSGICKKYPAHHNQAARGKGRSLFRFSGQPAFSRTGGLPVTGKRKLRQPYKSPGTHPSQTVPLRPPVVP